MDNVKPIFSADSPAAERKDATLTENKPSTQEDKK
jgi:hypothetical protein